MQTTESGRIAAEKYDTSANSSSEGHGARLQSIQLMRAFAVCLVVAHHSFPFMHIGAWGVDLFFVVSGFVIATSRKDNARGFLFRRFWRIYPLYWILSFPLLIRNDVDLSRLASSLSLWPFWGANFSTPYLLVAWTLCFEVLFYLAAALAIKNPRLPLVLYGCAALVALLTNNALAGFIGNPMVLEFLGGAVLARTSMDTRRGYLAVALALAILALAPNEQISQLSATAGFNSAGRLVMWGIPAMLVVYFAVTIEEKVGHAGPLVALGDASYSIYLIFAPLTAFLAPKSPVAAFGLSLLAGFAVHRAIEKPILGLVRPRLASLRNSVVLPVHLYPAADADEPRAVERAGGEGNRGPDGGVARRTAPPR